MIGFFIKSGGKKANEEFGKYIFGIGGIRDFFEIHFQEKEYGDDLKLILVKFYVDGEVTKFSVRQRRLSNFSSKNKDIAVDCFINNGSFFDKNEEGRKEEICKVILDSVILAQERLKKRKLSINWNLLKEDINAVLVKWKNVNPSL